MIVMGKVRGIALAVVVLSVAFVLLGTAGIATWEYSNSDAFCADACHGVHPENTYAHHGSQHARVACVECHMGRVSTFESMARKARSQASALAAATTDAAAS